MIEGFSKLTRLEKLQLIGNVFNVSNIDLLDSFRLNDIELQESFDNFSENVVSNFHLPYAIAPNFLIDGKYYAVPMVTEESSVVAAAGAAAKFWAKNGGFQTSILKTDKPGHVYFNWSGKSELVLNNNKLISFLIDEIDPLALNMKKRGGGLKSIEITLMGNNRYKLEAIFETVDSMGANFINTCLEAISVSLERYIQSHKNTEDFFEIVMAILSNHTPHCVVESVLECRVQQLAPLHSQFNGLAFAKKFVDAVEIACVDTSRAVTHNKGIYNGISSVLLATANDFRAAEAGGHAYAVKDGMYRSLSTASVENDIFRFVLKIPLAIGTVGGLTKLHPLAKFSLELMGMPNAKELMSVIASAGLASNFAAVKALTTSGIQKGHMKMHLENLLNALGASNAEKKIVKSTFENKTVSNSAVQNVLNQIRST